MWHPETSIAHYFYIQLGNYHNYIDGTTHRWHYPYNVGPVLLLDVHPAALPWPDAGAAKWAVPPQRLRPPKQRATVRGRVTWHPWGKFLGKKWLLNHVEPSRIRKNEDYSEVNRDRWR